jgi:hypothetical protein
LSDRIHPPFEQYPPYDVPCFLNKEEINTIRAGALFPSQSQTVNFISSAENGVSKDPTMWVEALGSPDC